MLLTGFPPVVNKSCRILILGSMPGVQSLLKQEYYGHPQNHFWKVASRILKTDVPVTYSQKKKMLLSRGIAVWDVIHQCTRIGSLDSRIKDVIFNDFDSLFNKYPRIEHIFCNGNTSYQLFKKHFAHVDIPVVLLPSTSPAYTKSLEWKADRWARIMKYLK
jgi:hypoxanthine-DNA glycosylase